MTKKEKFNDKSKIKPAPGAKCPICGNIVSISCLRHGDKNDYKPPEI